MPIRKRIVQIIRTVSGRTPSTDTVKRRSYVESAETINPQLTKSKQPESFPSIVQEEKPTAANNSISEMEMGLVLYGRPSCPYCARVDRVIEELDIEDKITRRLTTFSSEWRTDLRTRTGSTQVPCLFIDGNVMFESADIIDWMRHNFD